MLYFHVWLREGFSTPAPLMLWARSFFAVGLILCFIGCLGSSLAIDHRCQEYPGIVLFTLLKVPWEQSHPGWEPQLMAWLLPSPYYLKSTNERRKQLLCAAVKQVKLFGYSTFKISSLTLYLIPIKETSSQCSLPSYDAQALPIWSYTYSACLNDVLFSMTYSWDQDHDQEAHKPSLL